MGPARWANALAIAAIVLLCISLGIIVYKTVLPTFKPPTFTQVVVSDPAGLSSEKSVEPQSFGFNQNGSGGATNQLGFNRADTGGQPQNLLSNTIPPVAFDMEAVRRRLEGSGYNLPVIATGRDAQAPVVLVIDSVNPSTTNDHIARFLNSKSGVAWKMIPPSSRFIDASGAASFAMAATRPAATQQTDLAASATAAEQGVAASPATQPSAPAQIENENTQPQANASPAANVPSQTPSSPADNDSAVAPGLASSVPATQPSSDVYVATGVTREVAEELRDALVNQQLGVAAQVYDSSGVAQATTQPAVARLILQRDLESASTSRPADTQLAVPPQVVDRAAGAATQPSAPPVPVAGSAIAQGTHTFSISNSNVLQDQHIASNAIGPNNGIAGMRARH